MSYLLIILCVTSFLILLPSRNASRIIAGITVFAIAAFSSWLAIDTLITAFSGSEPSIRSVEDIIPSLFVIDPLSAFFILIINFTMISGYIYSLDYLKEYIIRKPPVWVKIHYLALVWLQVSMVILPMLRNGFWFLTAWELMTLSSFILVIFDFDAKGTLKAGLSYLVQMHVGMLFLLLAFVLSSAGQETVSFDNLVNWFRDNRNWPIFLLFFIGFGLKAGFFVLHTWLPDAHPAAPSHVSGIMSGVMIKLGIYGILRVTTYLQGDFAVIGAAVIIISAITGVYGVMMAILQHDIKKLLAYHSIENIGIIGLGIGLGIFGTAIGNNIVAAAGYAGALLHTLNHSLFKSLLFYSAGSVISQVHTRNIEKTGGIMKFMPLTAWAFLIGAIAISGIPPFNGFISEFLIYTSMFHGLGNNEFYSVVLIFISMFSLVLIGGLALLCFTKVFSVVFLGQPRSEYKPAPVEAGKMMIIAKLLPVIPVVLIGLLPFLSVKPVLSIAQSAFVPATDTGSAIIMKPMYYIGVASAGLIALISVVILLRKLMLRKRFITTGPTWGCGYSAVDQRQQYTATSFVQEYASLTNPVIKTGYSKIHYGDDEIFPGPRDFHTHSDDFIRSKIINKPADFMVRILKKGAVFQTGKLQHYVLYVLLFMVLIFILTYLKII